MTAVFRQMMKPASALRILRQAKALSPEGVAYRPNSLRPLGARLREAWHVEYSAEAVELSTGRALQRLAVARHYPDEGLSRASRRLSRQLEQARDHDPDTAALCGRHDPLRILWSVFPLDSRLPVLWQAATPLLARQRLSCVAGLEEAVVGACRVEVLRYVPGRRCQLRYVLGKPGKEGRVVLGKAFRDGRGRELAGIMARLADCFARQADGGLWTPAPLAYLDDWRMLLQPEAGGTTLRQAMARARATPQHMEAAGRCAALLHASRLPLAASHSIDDEIRLAEVVHKRLVRVTGADTRFHDLLHDLLLAARGLAPGPEVTVHRDFYDRQLLVDGDRTALIDLDTVARGHAEIDLANFVAHLYLRAEQDDGPGAEHSVNVFLGAWAERAGRRPDPELLRFYLASSFFRLACLYTTRPGGAPLVSSLLRYARLALINGRAF